MEIAIFRRGLTGKPNSKKAILVARIEASSNETILDALENYSSIVKDDYSHQYARDIIYAYKTTGQFVHKADTQGESGGVAFLIVGTEKIDSFIKDEEWIDNVRKEAANYPLNHMHIIELHRSHRKNDSKAFNSCMSRIMKNYPDYTFAPIYNDSHFNEQPK